MKRLIWFPTGRQLWFDLACRLSEDKSGFPVVWLGDDRHLEAARQRFPQAQVLALKPIAQRDRKVPNTPPTRAAATFWTAKGSATAREHALKLMDRDDRTNKLSPLEREAWLHELVLWASSLVETSSAEALVMAEAPHSTPMYVLYAVASAMELPVLCFFSWPLLPGLVLRHGLDGPPVWVQSGLKGRNQFLEAGLREIDNYLMRFDEDGYAFLPRYMQTQANSHFGRGDTFISSLESQIAKRAKLLMPRRARGWTARRRLARSLEGNVSGLPKGQFVYFPLHYEPERTTNPDGGAFYDQLRTLTLLRSLLPTDISIAVKEHPSIFNSSMNGHLGRHPRHYSAMNRVEGLHLLPASFSSADLLRASDGVATITGTAALEAAALGKPALIFGNAWFSGCPNTAKYQPGFDWKTFASAPRADRATLREWMAGRLRNYVLPGTVNPSNERYFNSWYEDTKMFENELSIIASVLKDTLSKTSLPTFHPDTDISEEKLY